LIRAPATAFRAHKPEWAIDPISGEGAKRHGGRYNPPGTAALYLGLSFQTALLEANQGFEKKLSPTTIVEYDLDCDHIVDLTQASERVRWKIKPAELRCGFRILAAEGKPVPTWLLAEKLIKAGAAGILVQSFAPGATSKDINLVLWKWSSRRPHKIVVHDPDGSLQKIQRVR